ncbi:hypothetical protein Tco_1182226 [Tanacetum coccineum]
MHSTFDSIFVFIYSIVRNPWSSLIPLSRGSFDVLVRMVRLSKRKFGIVCHRKVVRIPLEGDEILRVHGERTQGVMKTLMNTNVVEFRVRLSSLERRLVAKSPYLLPPLGQCKIRSMESFEVELELLRKRVVAKWLDALRREMESVEKRASEMLRDWTNKWKRGQMMVSTLWIKLYSEYEYEIRYNPGKANVVTDALSRKERVKPRRVRAMAMTIQYGVRGMILAAQSELFKQENMCAERLHRKISKMFGKIKVEKDFIDETLARMDGILVRLLLLRWDEFTSWFWQTLQKLFRDCGWIEYCLTSQVDG